MEDQKSDRFIADMIEVSYSYQQVARNFVFSVILTIKLSYRIAKIIKLLSVHTISNIHEILYFTEAHFFSLLEKNKTISFNVILSLWVHINEQVLLINR